MIFYAVIDTNVLISALLTKHEDSATLGVIRSMLNGKIIPLYNKDILNEYDDVLHRPKFHLEEITIQLVLGAVKEYGIEVYPKPSGEHLLDMDDLVFYDIAYDRQDISSYLVTGNIKHYPDKQFVITPVEMMNKIKSTKVF